MQARLNAIAPVLLAKDVQKAAAFWHERLGFEASLYGEPPNFAIMRRDGVAVMLAQTPGGVDPPPANWKVATATNQAYIWVDNVDSLYEELQLRGAPIDFTLYDTPWGTREFGVQDLDDHDIAFGQVLC